MVWVAVSDMVVRIALFFFTVVFGEFNVAVFGLNVSHLLVLSVLGATGLAGKNSADQKTNSEKQEKVKQQPSVPGNVAPISEGTVNIFAVSPFATLAGAR